MKGKVTLGVIIPDDPKQIGDLEGKEVTFTAKKYRAYKRRSNEENAYYWKVIIGKVGTEWEKPSVIVIKFRDLSRKTTHDRIMLCLLKPPELVKINILLRYNRHEAIPFHPSSSLPGWAGERTMYCTHHQEGQKLNLLHQGSGPR